MTLRDVEVIELLGDEPELLAIADAVAATQPTPANRRRRRIAVRAAIVAAAAVVALAAVLAAPQSHSSGVLGGEVGNARAAILTRALAALGTGQIMHVVREGPAGTNYVDLKTGKRTPAVLTEELWTNRHGTRVHLVERVNGRVVGDLRPGDRIGSYAGPNSPDFISLWTGYHAALVNKYAPAELGGRGTIDGRSVRWIRFPLWYNERCPRSSGRTFCRKPTRLAQTEVALDAHTFKPIFERTYADGRRFDMRIVLARAIPYRPRELYRPLGPKLFAGMSPGHPFGAHPFAGVIRPEKLGDVPAPWLTPGKTVAGLRFRTVSRLLYQPLAQVGGLPMAWRLIYRAVKLVYRPGAYGSPATAIDETFRPADPRPWQGLPRGSIEVQPGASVTRSGSHRLWTGYLIEHGVYVTITTPAGEHALLTIARALHRARS